MGRFNQAAVLGAALSLFVAAAASAGPLQQQVRRFADMTVARSGGDDRVLSFGERGGELIVTGMSVTAPDGQPQPAAGAIAVMRTRNAPGEPADMPRSGDFDFARRTGIRLFIVATWTRPPTLWEIEPDRRVGVHYRIIDSAGRPGAWAVPMEMPAESAPNR